MGNMVMDKEEEKIPESNILIIFAAPGSAIMEIRFTNVSPTQAASAAWLLEKQAENAFFKQELEKQHAEQMKRIAVPGQEVIQPIIKP